MEWNGMEWNPTQIKWMNKWANLELNWVMDSQRLASGQQFADWAHGTRINISSFSHSLITKFSFAWWWWWWGKSGFWHQRDFLCLYSFGSLIHGDGIHCINTIGASQWMQIVKLMYRLNLLPFISSSSSPRCVRYLLGWTNFRGRKSVLRWNDYGSISIES